MTEGQEYDDTNSALLETSEPCHPSIPLRGRTQSITAQPQEPWVEEDAIHQRGGNVTLLTSAEGGGRNEVLRSNTFGRLMVMEMMGY